MLLGAAFLIGLALGFSIPETRSEHELMGETKDKLLSRAKELARGKMEKVEHVAMEGQKISSGKSQRRRAFKLIVSSVSTLKHEACLNQSRISLICRIGVALVKLGISPRMIDPFSATPRS